MRVSLPLSIGAVGALAVVLVTSGASVAAPLVDTPVVDASHSVVCTAQDSRLTEISGIAVSTADPELVWVHNDSGDEPRLYGLDARTCAVISEVTVKGVDARDWEGLAAGRDAQGWPTLWVGDIGDNRSSWSSVQLLRVREPSGKGRATRSAKVFTFTYRDRPHDAEALLVNPRPSSVRQTSVWVATKQLAQGRIYSLPPLRKGKVLTAKPVGPAGAFITDGAIRPDSRGFVLRDYLDAHIYRGLPPGQKVATIRLPVQVQGEAITWSADGRALLIMSERDGRLIRLAMPESVLRQLS